MVKNGLLRKRRGLAILVVVAGSLLVVSCTKPNPVMVKQLADLNAPAGKGGAAGKPTIGELQGEVRKYQSEVDKIYAAQKHLGRLYQMLALKYFNSNMYGPALKSFQQAIEVYPTNPVLAYMAGLCQAQIAKAQASKEQRQAMFEEAATYYKNAIAINGNYKDALFALSVLYVFELDKSSAAEPLLKKVISRDPKDTSALFLLARVYAQGGRPEEAAKIYDRISSSNATSKEKTRAEENKKKVLEGAFGK